MKLAEKDALGDVDEGNNDANSINDIEITASVDGDDQDNRMTDKKHVGSMACREGYVSDKERAESSKMLDSLYSLFKMKLAEKDALGDVDEGNNDANSINDIEITASVDGDDQDNRMTDNS